MKYVFLVLFLCIILAFSFFLYTWYRLHKQLHFHSPNSSYAPPQEWVARTQFVQNPDGQNIAYWYFPVDDAKAVVILIHGYNNPGGKPQMLGHAKYLRAKGYSTVLLDVRAYGESNGNTMSLGINEWQDVQSVYEVIKDLPENQTKKIGFFGVSMGAAIAINTAARTGAGDFVIASVPYASYDSLFFKQIEVAGFPPQIFFPFMKLAAKLEFGWNY